MKQDEQLFLEVSTHSDHAAFQELFHRYYAPLCAYAYKIIGNKDDAEDTVAHVFFKVWNKRQGINITSSVKYYLFAITRNRCIDQLKKNKRYQSNAEVQEGYALADKGADIEQTYQLRIKLTKVKERISSLPPKCQLIFKLSREEGLKYQEIAEKLSISIKTVETQMTKALKELRLVAAAF